MLFSTACVSYETHTNFTIWDNWILQISNNEWLAWAENNLSGKSWNKRFFPWKYSPSHLPEPKHPSDFFLSLSLSLSFLSPKIRKAMEGRAKGKVRKESLGRARGNRGLKPRRILYVSTVHGGFCQTWKFGWAPETLIDTKRKMQSCQMHFEEKTQTATHNA